MRAILKFSGVMCCIGAGIFALLFLGGEPETLPVFAAFFVVGVVLLAQASILDRLAYIELLLSPSRVDGPEWVRTRLGDFELLGDVEGEAMCTGCGRTAPKAGLYYNKSQDVYYHPQCLARDRSK